MKKILPNQPENREQQPIETTSECKICGVPAKFSYYGVLSCAPCRMFFRRNAEQKKKTFECDLDGDCEINMNTRHVCPHCRLKKCFSSGMQVELLRASYSKSDETTRKKKKMKQPISTALVRLNQPEQFPTLNLLRADQSILTIDQWNLLSNLSHCYDAYSGFDIGERYMSEQNNLPHKLRFKSASVLSLYQSMIDGTQLLYTKNQDFLGLSSSDRSIVSHTTMAHTTTLASNIILSKIGLSNYPAYFEAMGIVSHPCMIPIIQRLSHELNFDMIVLKLFVFIVSLSTITYTTYSNNFPTNLPNIKQILRIQDTYIEIAWRYLLYKYDYRQVVKYFLEFIRYMFTINMVIVRGTDLQWFNDSLDTVIQQTKQVLTVTD